MFKKNADIVISLGDDGAIISCFRDGNLSKRIFVTSPLSSDFVDLTRSMPDASIYMLLDTIDQNYIFSNIPQVGKSNVKKIIKRKMATEFDPSDINAYLFLNKDTTAGKKTLKYLFVSIRNGPPFKDWADALYALPNTFEGIYLLPVESEDFIKKIRLATHGETKTTPDEWEVFISYNRVGGVRQIVLKNGKLIFTRISQSVSLQTPDSIGRNISQEAANTLEYIRRIGFYDQTISVYVICAKEASNFIEIPGVKQKDIFIYNPFELAQKLGMAQASQDGDKFGDVIFAANFIQNKKKILQLTTNEIKTSAKLRSISAIVTVGSYLLMTVLPICAAYFIYEGVALGSKIKEMTTSAAQKDKDLLGVKDFEKEYGIKPQTLIDVVKAKNELSSKDDILFYILKKYQDADTFSNYISSVTFSADLEGRRTIDLQAVFDYSEVSNYSDVLYQIEKYTSQVRSALGDYQVEFEGLPNEKDIAVDFGKDSSGAKETVVMVKITTAGTNPVPRGAF